MSKYSGVIFLPKKKKVEEEEEEEHLSITNTKDLSHLPEIKAIFI